MTTILRDSPWPGMLMWVVLRISGYSLTIACARMYRAQNKVVFEEGIELNPLFQADVNALRRVSSRFVLVLSLGVALLWLLWHLTAQPQFWPEAYPLALGGLVSAELVVHIRHLRNWFLFGRGLGADGAQGHLEYPRSILLRAAAVEFGGFAGLFFTLFLVTASWFMLGGAVTCVITAVQHIRLTQKHPRSRATAA